MYEIKHLSLTDILLSTPPKASKRGLKNALTHRDNAREDNGENICFFLKAEKKWLLLITITVVIIS